MWDTMVRADAVRLETLYQQEGARLWRAVYLYAADQKPGDATGQGLSAFGAAWFTLSPAGNRVSGQATSSGGNGGSSY